MEVEKRLYILPSPLSSCYLQLLLFFNCFMSPSFLPTASSKFMHVLCCSDVFLLLLALLQLFSPISHSFILTFTSPCLLHLPHHLPDCTCWSSFSLHLSFFLCWCFFLIVTAHKAVEDTNKSLTFRGLQLWFRQCQTKYKSLKISSYNKQFRKLSYVWDFLASNGHMHMLRNRGKKIFYFLIELKLLN